MDKISHQDMKALIKHGVIRNTSNGFVDTNNNKPIGFYRCIGCGRHRYVQDKYVKIAKTLQKQQ